MNAKQTNEDKIYVYSSFKQFCLPVLEFLVSYKAQNDFRRVSEHDDWPIYFSVHISFLASQVCKINNSLNRIL